MSHESSQLDAGQLLAIGAPRTGAWTDIGRAEIVYTMFGKAKVRIIRKHDGSRRATRFAVLAAALAAVAALGWFAFSPNEAPHDAEPAPALSSQPEAAEPDVPMEAVAVPETAPAVEDKPAVRREVEVTAEKSAPRTEREPARNPQVPAKPMAASRAVAERQPEAVAGPAKKEASKKEIEMPVPAGQSPHERAVSAAAAAPASAPQAAKKPDAAPLQSAPTREAGAVKSTPASGAAPLPANTQADKSTSGP